jgi:ketosteroid isomerase-like protein
MGRNSVVAILAFVVGFGLGYWARASMGQTHSADTHTADLVAIEKLHRADIEATLAQEPNQLINLWSDVCVKLGVPGPAIIGKKGMQEVYRKFRADHPDFKVLKYAPEIQDLQVADGWAIEWVYYEATFKMSAKDDPVSMRRKDLRVLKRQSDRSWKFSREAETD